MKMKITKSELKVIIKEVITEEQANAVMDKVANMLYKKYGRHEESITSELKKEFKQYNNINKNITRG